MSVSISILAGAALKATVAAKLSDVLDVKFDLKDFFGQFRSGKSNDAALSAQDALEMFSSVLAGLGGEITALHATLENVEELVVHGIETSYAAAIRDHNTEAMSILQDMLLSEGGLTQTSKEALLSRSNALLNAAVADVSALAADPHTSAELVAASAFPTLTNAVAARVAVVKKYSDKGLAFTAIADQLDGAADLLADIYYTHPYYSSTTLLEKAMGQVESTVAQYPSLSTGILAVESTGPGGITRTTYIGESSYHDPGQIIPDHYGEIAGNVIDTTSTDPWATAQTVSGLDLPLADGPPPEHGEHAIAMAERFVDDLKDELDPLSAVMDIGDLTRGESIVLGSGDDDATGTAHADYIHGGDGDDELSGADGSDAIHGGEGMDDIRGGRGPDRLYGGLNRDDIRGGGGDDVVEGGDGRDTIEGGKGHDILYQSREVPSGGASDHDEGGVIFGDAGDDDIHGDDGADMLDGGLGDDLILGRGGADEILGGAGDDNLLGGSGDDHLFGEDGDDAVEGGGGHDVLDGGFGDDVLIGGAGWNLVFGGAGTDVARIDGAIAQFDFAQLADGTLAVFGAPGETVPVTFVGKRPGSMFDGVEILQFDDVAITNHWHQGSLPSSFEPVPERPSTTVEPADDLTVEGPPWDHGAYMGELDDLRLREPAAIERGSDPAVWERAGPAAEDVARALTAEDLSF